MPIPVSAPSMVVDNPYVRDQLIEERRASGHDRYDEVWDGVYVVVPPPDNEQQGIVANIAAIATLATGWGRLGRVYAGVNVSDRVQHWEHNFREPDVAFFRSGTRAQNCHTHWYGGPDFGVEIHAPAYRTHEKLGFYGQVGTRELMVIIRQPWKLELYGRSGSDMRLAGVSTLDQPDVLVSEVIPLSFRMIPGEPRPRIAVVHTESGQRWEV